MAYYRLYYINDGRFTRAVEIAADDDSEAVEKARSQVGDDVAELWLGERKVVAFNPVGQ